MTRSERLHRIAQHVEREQDVTSKRLAELRSIVAHEEARLETLRTHLTSYRGGLEAVRQDGTRVATLQNYMRFIDRLELAVREQEQRVSGAHHAYERQLLVWQEQRARTKAVESVADKQAAREHRVIERAEQRMVDDLVLQRFLGPES